MFAFDACLLRVGQQRYWCANRMNLNQGRWRIRRILDRSHTAWRARGAASARGKRGRVALYCPRAAPTPSRTSPTGPKRRPHRRGRLGRAGDHPAALAVHFAHVGVVADVRVLVGDGCPRVANLDAVPENDHAFLKTRDDDRHVCVYHNADSRRSPDTLAVAL